MPRARKHTGWYVIATIDGGTANARRKYLCGPFASVIAASKMLQPVSFAFRRLFRADSVVASVHTGKITRPKDEPLPRGSLDLEAAVDDTWIMYVLTDGKGRSWDEVFADKVKVPGGWMDKQ